MKMKTGDFQIGWLASVPCIGWSVVMSALYHEHARSGLSLGGDEASPSPVRGAAWLDDG